MNATLKKVLIGVGSFFGGIAAGVAAVLLHNRGATAGVREGIRDAERGSVDAEGAIGRAGEANSRAEQAAGGISDGNAELRESVERLGASVGRSQAIIDEIRQQGAKDGDIDGDY